MKNINLSRRQRGFTAIEVTIALIIGLTVLAGVVAALKTAREKSQVAEAYREVLQIVAAASDYRGNNATHTGVSMTNLNNARLLPNTIGAGTSTNPWGGNYTATPNTTDASLLTVTLTSVPAGLGLQLERKMEPATNNGNSSSVSGTTVTATF